MHGEHCSVAALCSWGYMSMLHHKPLNQRLKCALTLKAADQLTAFANSAHRPAHGAATLPTLDTNTVQNCNACRMASAHKPGRTALPHSLCCPCNPAHAPQKQGQHAPESQEQALLSQVIRGALRPGLSHTLPTFPELPCTLHVPPGRALQDATAHVHAAITNSCMQMPLLQPQHDVACPASRGPQAQCSQGPGR